MLIIIFPPGLFLVFVLNLFLVILTKEMENMNKKSTAKAMFTLLICKTQFCSININKMNLNLAL